MSPAWEPPGGPTRAAGGLLGVAGGETWRGGNGRVEPDGPVTTALVDLCHSYVARRGEGVPVEVAKRHDGVAGLGWLLAVAVVRDDERERVAETLELALAAGVALHELGACVRYVEIAARLFAGLPVEAAVEAATGWPASLLGAEDVGTGGASGGFGGSGGSRGVGCTGALGGAVGAGGWRGFGDPGRANAPELCGESVADSLSAGVWALRQTGGVADVVQALSGVALPSVGAAAAGLVGLRDGGGSVPAHWHRRLHCSAACLALAPGLVRARCRSGARNGAAPPGPSGPPGPLGLSALSVRAASTAEPARSARPAQPAGPAPLVVRTTCTRSIPSPLDPYTRPFPAQLAGVAGVAAR